jgi:hypothetical protein
MLRGYILVSGWYDERKYFHKSFLEIDDNEPLKMKYKHFDFRSGEVEIYAEIDDIKAIIIDDKKLDISVCKNLNDINYLVIAQYGFSLFTDE